MYGKMPYKNKKIKNATKVFYDWLWFDSKIECYCYKMLKENNIDFTLKYEIVIMEWFRYLGKKIQDIKMIPDFYLEWEKIIIDTKWWKTDVYKIKEKMLKKYFCDKWMEVSIYTPSTQKEVNALIQTIMNRKWVSQEK